MKFEVKNTHKFQIISLPFSHHVGNQSNYSLKSIQLFMRILSLMNFKFRIQWNFDVDNRNLGDIILIDLRFTLLLYLVSS